MAVGVLTPLAYVLVLYALSIAPVYLVAGRELGPLIGTIMGLRLLAELPETGVFRTEDALGAGAGLALSPAHVRKLLHDIGFSVQRPKRVLARADAAERERWQRYTYPNITNRN